MAVRGKVRLNRHRRPVRPDLLTTFNDSINDIILTFFFGSTLRRQ